MLPRSFRSVPSRRSRPLPVSADVAPLEQRTFLSAAAIYPLPAADSVSPQAAPPSNFAGDWNFTVVDATNFLGLHLNQTGSTVSGTFDFDSDGTIYALPLDGSVKGKKMTLVSTGEIAFTMKVKLQSETAFKGVIRLEGNPKTKALGTRVTES